jgi:hypothetical protein
MAENMEHDPDVFALSDENEITRTTGNETVEPQHLFYRGTTADELATGPGCVDTTLNADPIDNGVAPMEVDRPMVTSDAVSNADDPFEDGFPGDDGNADVAEESQSESSRPKKRRMTSAEGQEKNQVKKLEVKMTS